MPRHGPANAMPLQHAPQTTFDSLCALYAWRLERTTDHLRDQITPILTAALDDMLGIVDVPGGVVDDAEGA